MLQRVNHYYYNIIIIKFSQRFRNRLFVYLDVNIRIVGMFKLGNLDIAYTYSMDYFGYTVLREPLICL